MTFREQTFVFLVTASGLLGKLILDPIFGFHGFIRKQPLSLCILAGPITGSTIIYRHLTSFVNPVAAGGILQQSLVSSALGRGVEKLPPAAGGWFERIFWDGGKCHLSKGLFPGGRNCRLWKWVFEGVAGFSKWASRRSSVWGSQKPSRYVMESMGHWFCWRPGLIQQRSLTPVGEKNNYLSFMHLKVLSWGPYADRITREKCANLLNIKFTWHRSLQKWRPKATETSVFLCLSLKNSRQMWRSIIGQKECDLMAINCGELSKACLLRFFTASLCLQR